MGPEAVCLEGLNYALTALTANNRPALNRVHVAAGLVAWDDCCGMLVAAPERVFRTGRFPIEGPDPMGCFDGLIAVNLVVLLMRCIPVLDNRGNAPSVSELDAAYRAVMTDSAIVWNALSGPWPTEWETSGLNQMFVGAEGGCIGVETRLVVGVPYELWCL